MAGRDLRVTFTGDTSGLVRATDQAQRAMGQTEKSFSVSAAGIAKVGAGMAAGFVADQAIQQLTAAVSKASDLNESMSKVGVAFGAAGKDMTSFIKDSNRLGLSDLAAAEMAGNLGVLGGQLGLADDASAAMSKQVMQLGADLGSFNNLDTADTVARIQKAMTGELDGVKQLTPALNAAMVQQRALADTGKTSVDQLTAQEKATATLALITEQSSDAMGDMARTSDSAANQQKVLSSQMEDMQTTLGNKLLPLWNGFLDFVLNKALPGLQQLASWIAENVPPIYEQYFKPTVDAVLALIQQLVKIGTALWEQFGASILNIVKTAFTAIVNVVKPALSILANTIKLITSLIKGDWSGAWRALTGIAKGALDLVVNYVKGFLKLVGAYGRLIGDALAKPFEALAGVARAAFNGVARLWNSTVGRLEWKVPSWVPGIGGNSIGVPDIPIMGAQAVSLYMPAGTSGPEVVGTLQRTYRVAGGGGAGAFAAVSVA